MAKKTEVTPEPVAAEPATREELLELAESMNSVLQFDPAIVITDEMTEEDIEAIIIEQATGNIYEIDFTPDENDETVPFFSEADAEILALLEVEVLAGAPAPAEEAPVVKKEEKPAKGKGGKKVEAPVAPVKAGKKADPAPAKKTPAPAKEDSYTRSNALVDAFETGGTVDELIELADKLFVKENKGAVAGKTTSRSMLGYVLPTLKIIGYVKIDANGKITKKK